MYADSQKAHGEISHTILGTRVEDDLLDPVVAPH
jgi:hypothetical protein